MEIQERNQIILAAVQAAGPVTEDLAEWQSTVAEMATRITAMCSDQSPVAQAIGRVADSKVFVGSVVSIEKEASSTRGIVTIRTRPSQYHPDGTEQARTDRTDNAEGMAMARSIKALVGHRVRFWVQVEEYGNGSSKVRVIRNVEDLGVDRSSGKG